MNVIKEARTENDLKKMILKSARDCAKKFEKKINQDKEQSFSVHCSKKVQKILKLKAIPGTGEMDSMQKKMDLFDKIFYVNHEADDHDQIEDACNNNQINDDEDLCQLVEDEAKIKKSVSINGERDAIIYDTAYRITQLDGNASESSEDEGLILKSVFSVKSETKEITQLLTFFRSFDFMWRSLASHKLCSPSDGTWFFCHMGSSCLRLRATRGRCPKSFSINSVSICAWLELEIKHSRSAIICSENIAIA